MNKRENNIRNLDSEDSAVLNQRGWFLLTYYPTKDDPIDSRAHQLAIEKAMSISREAGLRIYKKGEYTVFEIWEHW